VNCLFSENKWNTYDKSQRTSRQSITGCVSRPMRSRRCNFKRLSHKLAKYIVCSLSLSIALFYLLSNVVYIVFVWLTDCNKGYVWGCGLSFGLRSLHELSGASAALLTSIILPSDLRDKALKGTFQVVINLTEYNIRVQSLYRLIIVVTDILLSLMNLSIIPIDCINV